MTHTDTIISARTAAQLATIAVTTAAVTARAPSHDRTATLARLVASRALLLSRAAYRDCCGATSALRGAVDCSRCETVAQHDAVATQNDTVPCVLCQLDTITEHDYRAPDGTRYVRITVETYTTETVNGYTGQADIRTETDTYYGVLPIEVVSMVRRAYPSDVETTPGGARFTSEPSIINYETNYWQTENVDVVGYSPLTMAVVTHRIMDH